MSTGPRVASWRRPILSGALLLTLLLCLPTRAVSKGNELATLKNPALTDLNNYTYRQDICNRYDKVRNGEVALRDALSGMALQPLMALGDFFHYDPVNGIDPEDPGLIADLMDILADSANFTWRQSFGVMEEPETLNQTWTNMLLWAIENYDVAVNWWDHSLERMELGAAYIVPWFDGSLILIDQQDPPEDVNDIKWFNWLSPFETSVWILIVFTVFLSAFVFQLIESIHHEREERPFYQWFSDNLYLSALNFTQNFEYAPNTAAGRIFAFSMAMWALVMTATYTANLASLFVQDKRPAPVVDSIDQAIEWKVPICTMGLTNSDSIIQTRYEDAIRKPKATELEMYQALRAGECGLIAAYKDSWLGYQGNSQYNPGCDLEWIGRVIEDIKSGFATKADAGHRCTSLVRDVLNLHMTELIEKGELEMVWEKHRAKTNDQDCETEEEVSDERRRLGAPKQAKSRSRKLKGGKASAAAAAGASGSGTQSLKLNQMLGTFTLHWASMAIAIIISWVSNYCEQRKRKKLAEDPNNQEETEIMHVVNRRHGPIIGSAPKMNTSMTVLKVPSSDSDEPHAAQREFQRRPMITKNYSLRTIDSMNHFQENHRQHPHHLGTIEEVSERNNNTASTSSDSNSGREQEQSLQGDWRTSHAELQQRQQDLSSQMDSVMTLLQEMRKEQKELIQYQRQFLARPEEDHA